MKRRLISKLIYASLVVLIPLTFIVDWEVCGLPSSPLLKLALTAFTGTMIIIANIVLVMRNRRCFSFSLKHDRDAN